MIKFVNIQANGICYKNYILIKNINDLNLYYEIRKKQIFEVNDCITGRNERNSILAYYFKTVGSLAKIIGDVYRTQIEMILNGKKLAVNLIGGYFPLPDDCIIEDLKENNSIFKPKFI